jgi:hypothetical protein
MSKKLELECDGCLRTIQITQEEYDGDPLEWSRCTCKDHWGWMLVGGKAWHYFHDNGLHPMRQILDDIGEFYQTHLRKN